MPYRRPLTFWEKTKIALSVVFHKRTPFSAKAVLGGGLLYGIMPLDLIPDFLPFSEQPTTLRFSWLLCSSFYGSPKLSELKWSAPETLLM